MPSVKKFMEAVNYKVIDGFAYGWDCFGKRVFAIDAGNFVSEREGYWSAQVVFDLVTQKVYMINWVDHLQEIDEKVKCGIWIDPEYLPKFKREAKKRGFRWEQCFDDVDFELQTERAIMHAITVLGNRVSKKKKKKK